jgi:glycosyltransferase involved in cell wall biosynthesis
MLKAAPAPVVSVLMPTYNRLEFLPATVESVFAQTLEDWELIIADDGSGQDTRAYLESLDDPRVKVIWLAHTGKPSVVTNAALGEARGEYVAFLDSDDLWHPRKLQRQVQSLREHPERGWSYTKFAVIDAAGRTVPGAGRTPWPTLTGWILEQLLREVTVIAQPSVLVSRQLLQQLGAFDEELVMCYDDELWFRLAARSEIDGVDEPLTLVRRHASHSGNDIIAWRDRRRVFEKALRGGGDDRLQPILRRCRAQMSAGLARSQAAGGRRLDALATVLTSLPHSWTYAGWWRGALAATATALAPAAALMLLRRGRNHLPGHSSAP